MKNDTLSIIIDAGATKTHFAILKEKSKVDDFSFKGINVNYSKDEDILSVFSDAVAKLPKEANISKIYYYGAGCATPHNSSKIYGFIQLFFPLSQINVYSDILAACRALSGKESSIVSILGTGSTSCFYDGNTMVKRAPSLGFMLGDEASGTYIGKMFIKEYLSLNLSDNVSDSFEKRFNLTPEIVLIKLYKEEHPNRFLSSLAPFVKEFESEECVSRLLHLAFDDFFRVNKKYYNDSENFVWNFTGTISAIFDTYLKAAAKQHNCTIGKIVSDPMPLLIEYHNLFTN